MNKLKYVNIVFCKQTTCCITFSADMNHIPRLSEGIYSGMCQEVGSPTQVKMRREVADVQEVLGKFFWKGDRIDGFLSGSRREGFRFQSSDKDIMIWLPNHKLISDLSHISLYRTPQHTVILMEWESLPPGFTRLKMMTPTSNQAIQKACVTIDNELYISSARHMQSFTINFDKVHLSSELHGPCKTFNIRGEDTDIAFCFRSHHWPEVALPWIQRCRLKQWPTEYVLSAIIKEGCHVVPISSLPSRDERESEWRISFSRSEQMLVYSMNHCQFLCYGLLKIFLKEVINAENNNPCLCSYFMKTIVFWVIQSNSSRQWFPSDLLHSFWTCFKLLVSWVYKGECPNFFIPENNMFRLKVIGHTQSELFNQLYDLYCKGISCLLLSPTIGKYLNLMMMVINRTLEYMETDILHDSWFFDEKTIETHCDNEKDYVLSLNFTENLLMTRLTEYQTTTVDRHRFTLIRDFSWFMVNQILTISSNRDRIYIYKKAINMMKLATRMSSSSEILYLALFYYRICAYEKSLKCLQMAKNKWFMPYVLYDGRTSEEMYRHCLMGLPLGERLRHALICDICLHNSYTYIDELELEQNTNRSASLFIPPFVMLNMLFVLNHHRLGDTVRSQQSREDLHTLLLYDDGTRVREKLKDISWQILGICQQICGDCVGALDSYRRSLKETPHHGIQKATLSRIQTINDMHVING